MKLKFKDGDKVRVKNDLIPEKKYGKQIFVSDMAKHRGNIATVKVNEYNYYNLDIDDEYWNWTDEMLEPYVEPFSITITSDGVKTVKATYINGEEIKESIAKCNLDEGDTFDINTGVDLALDRLGIKRKCTCELNNNAIKIKKLETNKIKPKKKILQSKVSCFKYNIGIKVPFTDIFNNTLYTGDVVDVYSSKDKRIYKDYIITFDKTNDDYFVYGFRPNLSSLCGITNNGVNLQDEMFIVKSKSYKYLKVGDKIRDLEVIEVEE